MRIEVGVVLLALSLLALSPPFGKNRPEEGPQFWYEDNNMRRAGGYPPDFREMFTHPESWGSLRSLIDVYYIRGNTLQNIRSDLGEDFVRDCFVKVLSEAGIPIAIDNYKLFRKVG